MTDFIEVYDNALSSVDCNNIIKWVDNNPQHLVPHKKSLGVVGQHVKGLRFSDDKSWISECIFKCIDVCLLRYTEKHPQLNDVCRWTLCDDINIQKYKPGEGYNILHAENIGPESIVGYSSKRMLVWMIYLNTVNKGGTYFDNYDRTLESIEGRCVIWPSYWTHFHKGIICKTQTKYIATGWFMFAE